MKAKTVREILIAARWMIDNIGWCQDNFVKFDKNKPIAFCAVGALDEVEIEEVGITRDLYLKAISLLAESLPKKYHLISHYNDIPIRTKKEILSLYDRAIKKVNRL